MAVATEPFTAATNLTQSKTSIAVASGALTLAENTGPLDYHLQGKCDVDFGVAGASAVSAFGATPYAKPGGTAMWAQFSEDGTNWIDKNGDDVANSGAIILNGSTQDVVLPNAASSLLYSYSNAPFAISIRYRMTSTAFGQGLQFYSTGGVLGILSIRFNRRVLGASTPGYVCFILRNEASSSAYTGIDANFGSRLYDGQWHTLTLLYVNPSTAAFFLDGNQAVSSYVSTAFSFSFSGTGTSNRIGSNATVNQFFPGTIDRVQAVRTSLTDAQIKEAAMSGCTLPGTLHFDYRLNGNCNDSGPNAWHGTASDTPSYVTDTLDLLPVGETIASDGNVLDFDGANDEVRFTAHSSITNLFSGGGTLSAWIYPRGGGEGGEGRIVDKRGTGYFLSINGVSGSTGKIRFFTDSTGGSGNWISSADVTLNQWNHVAVTFDSDDVSVSPVIYINGAASTLTTNAPGTGNGNLDTSSDLVIGDNEASSVRCFDGYIGSVAFHSSALSAGQILTNFTLGYPSATGRVHWWKLNEGSGTTAIDYGSNPHNGTMSLTPSPVATGGWNCNAYRPFVRTPGAEVAWSPSGLTGSAYMRIQPRTLRTGRTPGVDAATATYTASGNRRRRLLIGA